MGTLTRVAVVSAALAVLSILWVLPGAALMYVLGFGNDEALMNAVVFGPFAVTGATCLVACGAVAVVAIVKG